MRNPLTLIATITALIVGCDTITAPGLDCTEIGCSSGLTLNFGASTPGLWTFEVDLVEDGAVTETIVCQSTLPLSDTAAESCDNPSVFLFLSGSALPDEEHQITGMNLMDLTPEEVNIRVFLDDESILSESIFPTYESYSPNGEECGPTCYSGEENITIE